MTATNANAVSWTSQAGAVLVMTPSYNTTQDAITWAVTVNGGRVIAEARMKHLDKMDAKFRAAMVAVGCSHVMTGYEAVTVGVTAERALLLQAAGEAETLATAPARLVSKMLAEYSHLIRECNYRTSVGESAWRREDESGSLRAQRNEAARVATAEQALIVFEAANPAIVAEGARIEAKRIAQLLVDAANA